MFKTKEETEKAAADKLKADEKAKAEKLQADKKAEAEESEVEAKAAADKLKGERVGKELKIELPSGAKFEGLCTGARSINGGEQVFLKLNGLVSRYFNVEDIVE